MKNICVKVTSEELGKKVVASFLKLGVDTREMDGLCVNRYYGLFDGIFENRRNSGDSTPITLEELQAMAEPTFVRGERVLVWDCNHKNRTEAIFLAEIKGIDHPFVVVNTCHETFFNEYENGNLNIRFCTDMYRYCEKLPKLPTIEELCIKTNLTENQLKKIINNE